MKLFFSEKRLLDPQVESIVQKPTFFKLWQNDIFASINHTIEFPIKNESSFNCFSEKIGNLTQSTFHFGDSVF